MSTWNAAIIIGEDENGCTRKVPYSAVHLPDLDLPLPNIWCRGRYCCVYLIHTPYGVFLHYYSSLLHVLGTSSLYFVLTEGRDRYSTHSFHRLCLFFFSFFNIQPHSTSLHILFIIIGILTIPRLLLSPTISLLTLALALVLCFHHHPEGD
ncbi:hypothetical protein SODALDRAFT_214540 [Sodiomyces alkalinus F11]|uniref:Uncharacterized protein n=1 Tax=Sodiomyces alkalinus (strain CBS 110278 / VKM F-3762 / F11) TaxID=1314773 RepID=A0A3N2PNY8_SODAK|nr:hypothetical protein SODALDRAFT_214540 [Sodiomyces alkalinus F11]ROT36209.1 hypothetical protein SODALDRAFT_214540 [Sodiomyces alkalinus F11]